MGGALLFSTLQQEAPGRCPVLQRHEERPRAAADPAEAVGAEEAGEQISHQQSGPVRRHAGGCGHGLPVRPALLLPQLLPVGRLERQRDTEESMAAPSPPVGSTPGRTER